jgi:STE24 endopeptidase
VNEDKSARYHKLGRRAAFASAAWSAGLLILLAATPASAWLRDLAEGWAGRLGGPSFRTAGGVPIYLLALGLIHEAGSLPIAFYRGFLLEHRYGLSTEPFRGWVADQVKGGLLGAGLSLAGFSLVYLAIRRWPTAWWMAAGAGFAAVVLALTRLGPVLLMPLFFTFRPLGRDDLRARLVELSRRAGVKVMDACEWQVSTKTKKANAALAGLGGTRRILVSDTLLAGYSDDEIEAILAHELGHHVRHHIGWGIGFQTLIALAGFFIASRVLLALAPRLGWTGAGDVAGLPVLALTAGVLSLVLLPATNALSRRMERSADRFAFELTGQAAAFASAMQRLAAQNLAEEHPSRLSRWLFYTHPPVAERIARAREWAGRGRPDGPPGGAPTVSA